MKKIWGCESPSQMAVWVDEETGEIYYNCPLQFIPENVIDWWDEFKYDRENGTAPSYGKQNAKSKLAWVVYSQYRQTYTSQKSSKKRDGLLALKEGFHGRRNHN